MGSSADRRKERRLVERIKLALAASAFAISTENEKLPPLYERNSFVFPASTAITIILTVIAAMKHDLRWLLIIAWPVGGLCIWSLSNAIFNATRHKFSWIVVGIAVFALALFGLNMWLTPEPSFVKIVPVITWVQPTPITEGESLSSKQLNATALYSGPQISDPAIS